MNNQLYLEIFNCNRKDLYELIIKLESRDDLIEQDKLALLYARVIHSFFDCDINSLELYVNKLEKLKKTSNHHNLIYKLSYLRKSIKDSSLKSDEINDLLKEKATDDLWNGEINFVCAFAFTRVKEVFNSRKAYSKAHEYFEKSKAYYRSLLAFKNYVVAESILKPEKKMIFELKAVVKKAEQLGATEIAGSALINLATKYEKIGAQLLAVDYAKKSLTLLSDHQNTQQYGYALSQTARMCYGLGMNTEADNYLEELKEYPQPDLQACIEMLEKIKIGNKTLKTSKPNQLMPWWKDQFEEKYKAIKLGKLGNKLVNFLKDGPRQKIEIINHLYGESIDPLSLENRFHVLLSRLRKKCPNLINYQNDGKYSLSSDKELKQTG